MTTPGTGLANELLRLAFYNRLLYLFRFTPWFILALLLAALILILLNFNKYENGKRIQETDNAYTHFDRIVLEPKVSGYIREVGFSDFQKIRAGDILIRLDDADFRTRVAQARASRDRAAADLARLDLEIDLQKACIQQAKAVADSGAARLDLATRENDRTQKLFRSNAVSAREADTAEINLKTARNSHRESLAEVAVQERRLALQQAERALREADLHAAEASLQSALIDLGYTVITAPRDGRTGARKIHEGELVKEGMQLATLIADMAPYVIANYKETQISNIRFGQPVDIVIDAFPGEVFKGRVESVSPATGATFSLLPRDTTSGNFTKVVQRVPVRISLDPGQRRLDEIRAGMSVITRIDTADAKSHSIFSLKRRALNPFGLCRRLAFHLFQR